MSYAYAYAYDVVGARQKSKEVLYMYIIIPIIGIWLALYRVCSDSPQLVSDKLATDNYYTPIIYYHTYSVTRARNRMAI